MDPQKFDMQRLHDFGPITDTLYVGNGPLSNLEATNKFLTIADQSNARTVILGDVAGYGAHPKETVRLVQSAREKHNCNIAVVAGNVEMAIVSGSENCGCGFAVDTVCDRLSKQWYDHILETIETDQLFWMSALHHMVRAEINGVRIACIHASPSTLNEFVWRTTSDDLLREYVAMLGVDVVVAGHTGLPFIKDLGEGKAWMNVGAIGMPANEGFPHTWYGTAMPFHGGVRLRITELHYDHTTEATSMRRTGLMEYGKTLLTGLWPSNESVPECERDMIGKQIEGPVCLQVDAVK